MKITRVYRAALVPVLLLSALVASPATAQIVNVIKMNLPFDATIAGNALPAGEYTIQAVNGNNGSPILAFRSDKGKTVEVLALMISTPDNSTSPHTEIVLEERGNDKDIVKLWMQGQAMGYRFAVTGSAR